MINTPLLSLLENVRRRAEQSIREKLPTDTLSPTSRVSSAMATRRATNSSLANTDTTTSNTAMRFLDQLSTSELANVRDDVDVNADYEVDPRSNPPGTDLAVISREIANFGDIEPEWHAVKNLPGYMSNAIRAMGRIVFGQFTDTPIEEINVIANLQGNGPNSDTELAVVARYMRKYGQLDQEMSLDFEQTMPGYTGDVKIYKTNNYTFCVVVDFMGKYVYAWPSKDEVRAIR